MGMPSPGYDIDIIDENGNSCEVGDEGQIVIYTGKANPWGCSTGITGMIS